MPTSVLAGLASLYYALYRLPQIREQFGQWEGAQRAVLVVTGTWILAILVKNLVREYGLPLAERTDTDVEERIVRLLDLTAVSVIWISGILITLREGGIQVTAFLASLGIAGLAVALAAKTILSNVLTGVTLTAGRNFRVGDRIEVGEYIGDVLEINLHKTVLRTRDNEIVMIPNDVLGRKEVGSSTNTRGLRCVSTEQRSAAYRSVQMYGAELQLGTSPLPPSPFHALSLSPRPYAHTPVSHT